MTVVARAGYDDALSRARTTAYDAVCPAGEYVGQESFMTASEILSLARRAGARRGVSVLDLCCGVAGPGRLVTARLGCTYLGIDRSPEAVAVARSRAGAHGLDCRFEVGEVPPVSCGPVDVVLLLETMLAFADKPALLQGVSAALVPGGRFAFTVEAGAPLTATERAAMPESTTVWPVPFGELEAWLSGVGLQVRWAEEHTLAHRRVADALVTVFEAERTEIAAEVGAATVDRLVTSHRLWSRWMATGRIRKLAVVAERTGSDGVREVREPPSRRWEWR
jgi:sarcosine/dimethylglycine N-methyltransferase